MEDKIKRFLSIGYGYGYGDGDGYGDGYGDGDGDGDGSDIKSINNNTIYIIDNTPTVFYRVHDNYAQGAIFNNDLTLSPCYIAKVGHCFAHGNTLRKARQDAEQKYYSNLPIEERIEMFTKHFDSKTKNYPAKEFFVWHNTLTGSCKMGRDSFCKEHDIDIDNDQFTVAEFIELTINSYGGEIIKELQKQYKQ